MSLTGQPMSEMKSCLGACFTLALVCLLLGMPAPSVTLKAAGNIKVVVETQQSGTPEPGGGAGIRAASSFARHCSAIGALTAGDRQTTVQRSSGIFTLVQ